jgi:hypothetical protein
MSDKFFGRCIGGPYAGQDYTHYASAFSVVWIEGNPMREIAFKREGCYEHFPNGDTGAWRWRGPTYRKPKETTCENLTRI